MDRTLNGLLVSRKVWIAGVGVLTAVVSHYLSVPQEVWLPIEVFLLAVIAGITVEDSAYKLGNREREDNCDCVE